MNTFPKHTLEPKQIIGHLQYDFIHVKFQNIMCKNSITYTVYGHTCSIAIKTSMGMVYKNN